jgi:CarboxypepD_reg-like domain
MKYVLILFFLTPIFSFAQIKPTGKVINAETKEPIAGANVFITNTSYKTITDAEGNFLFPTLNIQKGELIVNALGYKHEVVVINNGTGFLNVQLQQQAKELETVLVNSYIKDGYNKWGKLFLESFIGNTEESFDCKIENKEVLKFYFDKKTQTLNVDAREPLKIKNKALGYIIDYTLEQFEYNAKSRVLFFSGYPVFTEMNGDKRKQRKWKEKRDECFSGSVMHFMRALYRNKLGEQGFIVQKANKILNQEKAKLKESMRNSFLNQQKGSGSNVITFSPATENHASKILAQPDSIYQIISQILPPDSFAFALDSLTAGMFFEKHLLISYRKTSIANTTLSSFVKLIYPQSLRIFQNGSYYNSMNFFTERYWAETEKMARALPFDFVFDKKQEE